MEPTSNPKRARILEKGKELFWKHGFRRVSIEELCREAGVSKMTFYKFFSNKRELVRTIMEEFGTASMDKYRLLMDSDLPYPEKVMGMIELKKEQTVAMSAEFLRDYTNHADPEMTGYIEQLAAGTLRVFVDDLRKAQEEGEIRKNVKLEFILYYLNHITEMVHDEQLLALYETPQELSLELINFLFYGLLERDKNQ
ncbi:MAG: TetR/AcrR family transcriptional regulator [Bacteroidetes bacterium]|nr:MAG: TetR/AcrR family transcriptional regulator [Bacteroidota bacterium]